MKTNTHHVKTRKGFSLTDLLASLTVFSLALGLLLPAIYAAREDQRLLQCSDRIRRLSLACLNYAESHKTLPMALQIGLGEEDRSRPLPDQISDTFSWHARTLPYIEEMELYNTLDFNKRVNGGLHKEYRNAYIETHQCPADSTIIGELDNPDWSYRRSSYVANLGNTNFMQNDCTGWQGRPPYAFGGAPFTYNNAVGLNDIPDGTSNTMAFSEAVINQNPNGYRGVYGVVLLSCGSGFTAYNLPNTTKDTDAGRTAWDPNDFDPPFVNYAGGKTWGNATFPAKSKHLGGVNVAMVDGSVQFVSDSVDHEIWKEMSSTKGSFTKAVDPEKFEDRLLIDWIYQDFGKNIFDCFSNSSSSAVEQKMIAKVCKELDEEIADEILKEQDALVDKNLPGNDPAWKELYQKACYERRTARLQFVAEECPEFVYAKHYVMGGSHYTYTEDTTDTTHLDTSPDRRPGSSLWKMRINEDGSVDHELLLENKTGVIRDPDVSYDGKRILFSMRDNFETDDFHLFEMDIASKKVRQLTDSKGFADYEPIYLPDGNIIFNSSRCMQISDCWWTEVSNLYACDSEGRYLRRISFDQVTTNYPKVLKDGRVIYTRWEYQDRGQIFPQPLFVMNQDGSNQTEYYGNNSFFPTSILHAREIPNSSKVVGVASGHHTHQRGKLIMIDRNKGTQEESGITFIAPVAEARAERVDQAMQSGEQFQYPCPISEADYIVGYSPEGYGIWGPYDIPFALYYMDIDGRRELLAWDTEISCCQPVALMEREVPTSRPSQVDYNETTGRFYVQDVYEGLGLDGVERGTIKWLRVVEPRFDRTVGIRSNNNAGPAGGAVVPTPMSVANGAWDSKRILGNVPIEEDGSAYFEVPANTPVYFQLLDADENVVQTMRSWSTLMPNEFFACIGCHEPKGSVSVNLDDQQSVDNKRIMAREPVQMSAPFSCPEGAHDDKPLSYIRDIQPILDRHCVECHTGRTIDGKTAPFSLLGDQYNPETGKYPVEMAGRQFSESYINLTQGGRQNQWVNWLNMQSVPSLLAPYDSGAVKSDLIAMFRDKERLAKDENHKDVKLTESELKMIALWIDVAVPFCGFSTEANDWTIEEQAVYAYYQMKRDVMKEIEQKNSQRLADLHAGREGPYDPSENIHFMAGGADAKERFVAQYVLQDFPVLGRKSGDENVYRNLALNPNDKQQKLENYPHASTNSEFAYAAVHAANNVIDGVRDEKAWVPNYRTDARLRIDFGHVVETDKVVVTLTPETKWTSATLVFDDGSEENIELKPTTEPQSFSFQNKTTRSLMITNLKQPFPLQRCGIGEIEAWGVSVEE